ncbi:hypothetical protein L3Y34_012231 [Caenorhabditis briggsae]|uniref:Trifunctional purine biosynthetic protein adenosine-3 n=2 Tax=Caenorhabditis briggsae TaxID=6238 RepID=A0AAE8ZTJ5_CAEBR|nr:hypothetical protein L3Y34_012231 [Caenorhabditis briggsae]
MNVLVIGSGGREHALAWKLEQSSLIKKVIVAPGNGASGRIDLNPNNVKEVSDFCVGNHIHCVLIGPEEPLSNGLADHLIKTHPDLIVFGPTKDGAQLETSKSFSKQFMKEYGLPTADFVTVSADNVKSLDSVFERVPWKKSVVKADGLAAGKGVIIPKDNEEAKNAARSILEGEFGSAGHTVIIEERLEGYEVSALAFVDGISFKKMPLGKDHKRLLELDFGPNTGGMGVVAPVEIPSEVNCQIDEIFEKTLKGLANRKIKYCGVLYAGFMIVNKKPYLLEFNCRFGDPETQVLMRLLESDLFEIIRSCVQQTLSKCEIQWSTKSACGVVLASGNYPKSGDKGSPIRNVPPPNDTNVVFHAGTSVINNQIVTNGGRILCVTSIGKTSQDAREQANKVASEIEFSGKQFRKDIGKPLDTVAPSLSYGASGVNIDEGNQFVEDIKSLVKKTLLPGANQIGGFGAVLDLKTAGFKNDCQLVVGIDGVGTKIEVATHCKNFSGVGYDVVAMCVNDVICHCAKPIAFLDYFVCGKLDRSMATQVLASISDACVEAECSLIGGETAEMPGVYSTHQWDLAGCAIAARESTWPMLPLLTSIQEGDVIIGLPSSGLHSNGFSLARKVLTANGVEYSVKLPWDETKTFGDELLTGTKLYVKTVLPLLTDGLVKGCAHITGGGLTENAIRVLDENSKVQLVIDCAKWKPKEIFNWLASAGPVETKEMIRTFNCGIGMILIVAKGNLNTIKSRIDSEFFEIGHVEKSTDGEKIKFLNEGQLFDHYKYQTNRKRVKVAILISGTGTNMQKLIERSRAPDSNCEVVVVVSNKETAGGLKIASSYGIPAKCVPHTADRVTGETVMVQVLKDYGTELVCMGGYMRIISPYFIAQFPSRIINIHPSLLPSFKGSHALQDALDFGAKVVGCTAHFVDELVDHGDIIAQRPVMVEDGDTIETIRQKIQVQEHEMFPNAMMAVAKKILAE